jgi:hypothetical protein
MAYITTTQLAEVLQIKANVPGWDIGSSPTKEEVGTGNNTTLVFYLDQKNILSSSYTLYYGATEPTATALTETTHYTLDLTKGMVTLTTAGRTLISTNKIYAEYSYITNGMSDLQLSTVIARAEDRVNKGTNTMFTDGTATNPDYPVRVDVLPSQGEYNRAYFTKKRPVIDVVVALGTDISAAATSIDLETGDGAKLPTSGSIVIGSEIISYTGIGTDTLTGCVRGELGSTAATHTTADEIHTTIVRVSETYQGTAVSYSVLAWDSGYFADEDTGKVYIYKDTDVDSITADIPNRFEVTYYYGYDEVPEDIKRLTLLYAIQMLFNDTISKSLIGGKNEFNPEMLNPNADEIKEILDKYRVLDMGNT